MRQTQAERFTRDRALQAICRGISVVSQLNSHQSSSSGLREIDRSGSTSAKLRHESDGRQISGDHGGLHPDGRASTAAPP